MIKTRLTYKVCVLSPVLETWRAVGIMFVRRQWLTQVYHGTLSVCVLLYLRNSHRKLSVS